MNSDAGRPETTHKIIENLRAEVAALKAGRAPAIVTSPSGSAHTVEVFATHAKVTLPNGSTIYLYPNALDNWVGGVTPPE